MPASWTDPSFDFPQFTKVVMVLDVVESVRLMERDERGFVQRWHSFVEQACHLLPEHRGRMHKSLGDGLMLEFEDARGAVSGAFALQRLCRDSNASLPANQHMQLRVGAHLSNFVADQFDIYGTDVNLTARIATLAGAGEVVVTTAILDRLTPGLDAEVEDMGECHLKHVHEPIRAYRVYPPGQEPEVLSTKAAALDLRPSIAVIPFELRGNDPEHFVIGELVADGIISQLSRSPQLRVISRLSTTVFRGRQAILGAVDTHLDAGFVLSGSYITSGSRVLLMAELADVRRGEIVWAERVSGDVMDLLQPQSEMLALLAGNASKALVDAQVGHSLSQPLPRLDSNALMLSGIALMHRSSIREFERSREVLAALVDRHNRSAGPRAWLAKWHVLRIVRGLSDNAEKEARIALDHTRRALDLEPNHALTLSIEGLAYSQVLGEYSLAEQQFAQAIASNPNESMAWLFKSVLSTMWGSATDSVGEAMYASALSPLDPLKYLFELITASALLTDNQHEAAIEHAKRSLRANRHHSPTYRVLLTAQAELGLYEEARASLALLLQEQPNLTVKSYLSIGSTNSVTRKRCADALRMLGVPEH